MYPQAIFQLSIPSHKEACTLQQDSLTCVHADGCVTFPLTARIYKSFIVLYVSANLLVRVWRPFCAIPPPLLCTGAHEQYF